MLNEEDMGGAARVLGLAAVVMDAQLPVRLRVLVPAVEASSPVTFRPGKSQSSGAPTIFTSHFSAMTRLA